MTYRSVLDILSLAEELYKAKQYSKVIDTLGEIDLNSVSPEEKAHCHLLFVDASLYQGNLEVQARLDEALKITKQSHDDRKFAWAKYLYGWLLILRNKHFDAREVLLESYTMYKRCDLFPEQARVLNRLGQLCFHLGDTETAELYLKKCIAIHGDLQDHQTRIQVSGNLGIIYANSGYLSKAIDIYSQIASYDLRISPQSLVSFYIQSSIPLALRGDIEEAERSIDKSLPFLDNLPYEKATYTGFKGWIRFLEGRYEEALKYQNEALSLVQNIAPRSVLASQIKRELAETHIELNNPGEARFYNDEALSAASSVEAPEKLVIAGCYRNRGRLKALLNNRVKSREWFNRAIDLYKLTNSRYELAMTRYYASTSGAFPEGERHALLYLAREYFESEKVEHLIKRINGDLNGVSTRTLQVRDHERVATPRIVTVNDEMKRLVYMAEQVADSDMSVLLTGATGTGKDLFAKYIHHLSGRPGRFVAINAAAIPDSMVESELFGHRRGAFTNADRDKVGLIEVAHNGTLYLNEIADSSRELQAKLLDVLENRRIRRLGETREREVAFRLIAATNHNLSQLIDDGRFRIDLYHRLGEVPISLPPMSERLDDLQPLMVHFLSMAGSEVDESNPDFARLIKLLSGRDWPGNVRQLEAEAKRLALLSGGQIARMLKYVSVRKPSERDSLIDILRQTGWNRREAARKLGVSDTTIRRKIRKFKLDR